MANSVREAIGNIFMALGSRIGNSSIRSGDLTAMVLGEMVDPRLRKNQVIRILSSSGQQVLWHYVCGVCGNTNQVDIFDRDQKKNCVTCKATFSIKEVIHGLIREAQKAAIANRGATIDMAKPISREDFALAVESLPVHIPSQVTTPQQRRIEEFKRQLGPEHSGDFEYETSDIAGGWSNPRR
jgi:hypothetical protein